MAKRHLHTLPEWEESLRNGTKDIDARLVVDDIGDLKVGDEVHYRGGADARVRRMTYYPGFRDLLAHEDWRRVAPAARGPDEVLRILEAGHAQTVHQTGAVAIELEPVSA